MYTKGDKIIFILKVDILKSFLCKLNIRIKIKHLKVRISADNASMYLPNLSFPSKMGHKIN